MAVLAMQATVAGSEEKTTENDFCTLTVTPPAHWQLEADNEGPNLFVRIVFSKEMYDITTAKNTKLTIMLERKGDYKLRKGDAAGATALTLEMKLGDSASVTAVKAEKKIPFNVYVELKRPHVETLITNAAAPTPEERKHISGASGRIFYGTLTLYDKDGHVLLVSKGSTGGARAEPTPILPGHDTAPGPGYWGILSPDAPSDPDAMGPWVYRPSLQLYDRKGILIHQDYDWIMNGIAPGTHGCWGMRERADEFRAYMNDFKVKADWSVKYEGVSPE